MKLCLIIPTLNAGADFAELVKRLNEQTVEIDYKLVVDSGSHDQTVTIAKQNGFIVHKITTDQFNHGVTREMARKLTDADIVIFMTQDAIPCDENLIEKLIEPIVRGKGSLSYARQIPRSNADIFEAFPRRFNYQEKSHLRGIEDRAKYGIYTFFNSDSCAAYLNSALDEIGGFRQTLVSEDYLATARMLHKGHKIAYVAEAMVLHSHSYTLLEEFKRYFDTGYVRAENPWVQVLVGRAESRGKEYFRSLMGGIAFSRPLLIPYALVNTFIKLLGYRIGFWSFAAPKWWKKMLSGQRNYWDSTFYAENNRNKFTLD